MTNVKHNLKEDPPGLGAPVRDTHLQSRDHEGQDKTGGPSSSDSSHSNELGESMKDKLGKHQSHGCCKSCGSVANKCSCKDCQCQVCASKAGAANEIEPPIKSATSAIVVCGGGCIAAAQRAATGGCLGCECPAGKCQCTKCGGKADKNAVGGGTCPSCDCPLRGNCPCTNCKCPTCKSK
ncbi:hypothetical protein GN958_ATG06263 [Phytophthora infestans]|nr:hypothetical protein GN958_ATG06498 [Phytophthora infestans]KAF4144548.1 hypothetical protein GN958_ATG06263 [Phytophthora infestans]